MHNLIVRKDYFTHRFGQNSANVFLLFSDNMEEINSDDELFSIHDMDYKRLFSKAEQLTAMGFDSWGVSEAHGAVLYSNGCFSHHCHWLSLKYNTSGIVCASYTAEH
jgi:hypothetical protein